MRKNRTLWTGGILFIALLMSVLVISTGGQAARIAQMLDEIVIYLPIVQQAPATPTPLPTLVRTATATSPPVQPTVPNRTATATSPVQPTATNRTPTPRATPSGDSIYVDHASVALFDRIPDQYVSGARDSRLFFTDRSVGQNINEGLDCLAASSWGSSPAHCRRDYTDANGNWKTFSQADLDAGLVPQRIQFPASSVRYNRANWDFGYYEGEWQDIIRNFIQVQAPQQASQSDVMGFQFSYLNVAAGSNIASSTNGFFVDLPSQNGSRWDISDVAAFEAAHPDITLIYWTTSLARNTGSQESDTFNDQMRDYAIANGKVLFDVADILSHDDNGNPCYDNAGQNHLAICTDYTTETDGGHLGAVSGGKIRVVKAYWVLMAQITGWQP